MNKSTIGGVAVIAASILFLSACQSVPALAVAPVKHADRLQPLIGKRFALTSERDHAVQDATGTYTLASVGFDYAEFHLDGVQIVLVPLNVLRVTTLWADR